MELSNSRVLITGASRGTGEAMANTFTAAGADVALAARSVDALHELATRLGGTAYPIDLSDQSQVDGFIARVEDDGGPIDVMVNNAGAETADLIEKMDEDTIVSTISLNLTTPERLTRQVLPGMLERGRGHIVNISSMTGIANVPGTSVYSSTKAGLSHFTGGLRADLKHTPVGITLVEPGPVDTLMWDNITASPPVKAAVRRGNRLRLLPQITAEKLAESVVSAVSADRYHVRFPKRGLALYLLEDAPRRVTAASLMGVRVRP